MSLVVDACVALKWALPEAGADRARALFSTPPLIAPDFLHLECANVLATHVRRGALTADQARRGLSLIRAAPVRLAPIADYLEDAHALAVELGRSAYDCLYLALARAEGAVLVTADGKFVQAVLASPAHASSIREL